MFSISSSNSFPSPGYANNIPAAAYSSAIFLPIPEVAPTMRILFYLIIFTHLFFINLIALG
jgi:hypothetical protein